MEPRRLPGTNSSSDTGGHVAGAPSASDEPGDPPAGRRWTRGAIAAQIARLVRAIRTGDDEMVERAVISLSQRSRLLAPLAFLVGAFAMLFQGIKLLFTNWRLTLIQILPAMLIWAAMLDLKVHVLRGREFNPIYGFWLIPIVLAVASITAAAFFLNATFAFAVAVPGPPDIRAGMTAARAHKRTVLIWGFTIGLALGFAAMVTNRWGVRWFALSLGAVVALMMVTYVAVPGRLVGVAPPNRSRRDKLAAAAVGGAVGALVCSPPYLLGRLSIVLLGSATLRVPAVILLAIAVVLQTGATSAVKAVKVSAKLATGHSTTSSGDRELSSETN